MIRHLHILDPQLVDYSGHYFNYCAQIVREMRQRGLPVSIYARRTCTLLVEGVRPEPVFSHDIFKEVGRDPRVWAIENFHAVNQAFAVDLSKIDTSRLGAHDLLFFPTLHQNQLYAIGLWLARIPAAQRPAVAVLLRYLTHEMDYVRSRTNREMLSHFFRYAAQAVVAAQPRTLFCADTREMAQAFQDVLGFRVAEMPIAMEPAGKPHQRTQDVAERPIVAYQGHMSQLRGFHLLPEIITRCAKLKPRPQFFVQVQNQAAGALAPVAEWLAGQPAEDVRLIQGALEPADYFELMGKADVVLLPYAPTYYGTCSSGVFAEAAALAKVIVVPDRTVAARQGREYGLGVVSARDWTAASLASAIETALCNHPALRRRAMESAAFFREEQSVATFWNRMLALVPPVSAAV